MTNEKIQEVALFFNKHKEKVGEKQAVKDLQKAMNMLNKGKKDCIIEEKRPLKEDGILGKKLIIAFLLYAGTIL